MDAIDLNAEGCLGRIREHALCPVNPLPGVRFRSSTDPQRDGSQTRKRFLTTFIVGFSEPWRLRLLEEENGRFKRLAGDQVVLIKVLKEVNTTNG